MIYTLQNKEITVKISSIAAEIISVVKGGKERVWQNETGEWNGHGPVLFPVCGHFGVTVDGKSYPIGAHGFAKKRDFALTTKTDDRLTLALRSDETTKAVYPFDFIFEVTYRLASNVVEIEYKVQNPAKTPLYFACGGHESFALDTDRVDEYEIVFEQEEKIVHQVHDDDGYLTGETQDFGAGKAFTLPYDFFQDGRTLVLKDLRSRKATLCKKTGGVVAQITFDGFENLLLWRGGNAKYICIEPWTNLPDLANTPDIEFSQKAGVIKVDGESEITLVRTVAYGD
ncbi:MAG: hypothetical protein IJ317_04970 [Clostridia bacterium]|nr:hypothetical protein [Clostridia bacterium]